MLAALLVAAASVQGDAAGIVSLTQALFDAIGKGDAALWERTLADDASIIDEFGRRQDKAEAVKSIRPFPPGMSGSIELRDPHVRIHGEVAVIDCELYEREEVFGQKLVVRYVVTNTYLRTAAGWKLLAMHDVTLPTQPPLLEVRDLPLADYPGVYRYGPDRAYTVTLDSGKLGYSRRAGGKPVALEPLGKDVFMDGGDERNLIIFRRGADGRVDALIERRKFNDLVMKR